MEVNLVVLQGALAAPPELREFESGARFMRYLVTVRCDEPRKRTDTLPVTLWEPDESVVQADVRAGDRVWVVGTVQRRFWGKDERRTSKVEVIAHHVEVRTDDP